MLSCCRELERPAPALLAADLCEVGQERLLELVASRWSRERDVLLAPQVRDRLGQVVHRDDVDTRQRRLGRRLRRADQASQSLTPRTFRNGDRARYRPYAAVEGELADTAVLEQPLRRELVRAREQCERDRQVEAGSLLAQRRRREVDRDPVATGPRQHRVDDAAVHPVLGLLAGAVGEPDDRERGQLGRDEVRLDLHPPRLEPDDGEVRARASTPATVAHDRSRRCPGQSVCAEFALAQVAAATRIDSKYSPARRPVRRLTWRS